jgi:hypothetical protein
MSGAQTTRDRVVAALAQLLDDPQTCPCRRCVDERQWRRYCDEMDLADDRRRMAEHQAARAAGTCKCSNCQRAARQELSLIGATRNGLPWEEWERAVLADRSLTDMERAARLHRSLSSVTYARRRYAPR